MKQRITLEQLNELSLKSKKKFRQYWDKKGHPMFVSDIEEYDDKSKLFLPLLSIGQMIEFLYVDNGNDYDWQLAGYEVIKPEELCDALWEAVKEILE